MVDAAILEPILGFQDCLKLNFRITTNANIK